MDPEALKQILGMFHQAMQSRYPERNPLPSEDAFFKRRPEVAGYAADDGQVVLSPYAPVYQGQNADAIRESVRQNERVRQVLRDVPSQFGFQVTPGQQQYFQGLGSEYATQPQRAQETIVGRILSGDPTAGPYTPDQKNAAHGYVKSYFGLGQ